MKPSLTILFAGCCAAGLLTGYISQRVSSGTARSGPQAAPESGRTVGKESGISPAPAAAALPEISTTRPQDTVESLLEADEGALLTRLAWWLTDAEEQDIAAFWKGHAGRKNGRAAVAEVVFLAWTRVNPQAAISATARSPEAEQAWRAWACNDPQAALAAAAGGEEQQRFVASGIGEYHPAWLRQHYRELPEEAGRYALYALGKWGDAGNVEEMVRFCEEHLLDLDKESFAALTRKDPAAAFDWAMKNSKPGRLSNNMENFISQMAERDPAELARLASLTPGGDYRRKMETALFANLLKTDPAAALAQAKATTTPIVAAERLAAVGLSVVKTDPEQAFDLAKSLFAACPDGLLMMNRVLTPTGSGGGWGSAVPGVENLTDALFHQDPARLMDIVAAAGSRVPHENQGFSDYSEEWMKRDTAAYSDWLKQHDDPAFQKSGAQKLIWQLEADGQFPDAIAWAMTFPEKDRRRAYQVASVAGGWARKDRAAAVEWLETADLTEKEKEEVRSSIGQ